jgi:hypothetical protein
MKENLQTMPFCPLVTGLYYQGSTGELVNEVAVILLLYECFACALET